MRGSDHKSNFFVACWCFLHVGQYLDEKDYIYMTKVVGKNVFDTKSGCCEPSPWIVFSKCLHGCEELDAFPQSHGGFLFLGLEHALVLLVGLHIRYLHKDKQTVCTSCHRTV